MTNILIYHIKSMAHEITYKTKDKLLTWTDKRSFTEITKAFKVHVEKLKRL